MRPLQLAVELPVYWDQHLVLLKHYLQMKKRYKAEDKNCSKPGDCIVYIINDDFPDFPDKGTIFITFWQKPF